MNKARLVEMARRRMKKSPEGADILDPDEEIYEQGPDEDDLAMNDTYSRFNNEESDTMGQDSEDLDYDLKNEDGSPDQDEARKEILRKRARKIIG